jgi:hypothetical protein
VGGSNACEARRYGTIKDEGGLVGVSINNGRSQSCWKMKVQRGVVVRFVHSLVVTFEMAGMFHEVQDARGLGEARDWPPRYWFVVDQQGCGGAIGDESKHDDMA